MKESKVTAFLSELETAFYKYPNVPPTQIIEFALQTIPSDVRKYHEPDIFRIPFVPIERHYTFGELTKALKRLNKKV